MKEKLPHSTTSLVLGIFSIITCWYYGLPGVILGIVGFILGKKSVSIHNEDPELYEGIGNAKAGKVISIIGLLLSLLVLISMVWAILYFGWETLQDPELLQEKMRELQEAAENQ